MGDHKLIMYIVSNLVLSGVIGLATANIVSALVVFVGGLLVDLYLSKKL